MISHHLKTWARPGLAAVAAAFALTLLVPIDGTAQKQQTRRVILSDLPMAEQTRIATLAETTGEEADELLSRAVKADEATQHLKAGELFERSAQLRTPGDRRGVEGFEAAGTAYFNADKAKRASRAWEEAGNRALILGDVYAASENYMRAAVAAHEDGNRIRVSDMGWKAYYLTESPQLSKAQRTKLRRHITVTTVSADEAQAEQRTIRPSMRLVTLNLVSSAEIERLRKVDASYRALRDSLADTTASTPSSASTPSRSEHDTMTETIHFGHDRSDLSSEARAVLRSKVPVFTAHPSMRITVTGYASQRGTRAYNTALGLRRAEAARDYLVSQGIAENRIEIATRGEDDLAVRGPSEAADAANRRGEFTILLAERTVSQN
jgi:peptidoglycan-associated lipoprotein